jgi:hypothetical protein
MDSDARESEDPSTDGTGHKYIPRPHSIGDDTWNDSSRQTQSIDYRDEVKRDILRHADLCSDALDEEIRCPVTPEYQELSRDKKAVAWISEEGEIDKGARFARRQPFFDEEVGENNHWDTDKCRDPQCPGERDVWMLKQFTDYNGPCS